MRYNIEGGIMPILEVNLDANETIVTQGGGMVWMSPNLQMETTSGALAKHLLKCSAANLFSKTVILQQVLRDLLQ